MRVFRRGPWRAASLYVVGALALVGSAVAMAGGFTATAPVQVPDHPLAALSTACSNLVAQQTAAGSVNYPDAEVEPYVAVDPTSPSHLVASVQQDRWNDGGSNGLTNVYSTDGGATWHLASTQPAFSICEGAGAGTAGDLNRATDPWVSISSDGKIAYSISDSFNANGPAFGGASSIIISRSTDGGVTWQAPVTAEFDASTTELNDKESVTADPSIAKTAYAVWDRLVSPSSHANPTAFNFSPAFRGPAMFSKTTDGGVTWSQGRIIFDPGQQNQTIGNQIVVPTAGPAAGMLIDGFDLIFNKGGLGNNQRTSFNVAVIRSSDGGATWSQPTIVSGQQFANVAIAGHGVRSSDELPEFAAGPTGTLYAVWQDGRFSQTGAAKIALSQSTDGGLTWSAPIRVDQSPRDTPAFTPQVHVASDGTVAVTYYDLENATGAHPGLTDTFIVHCHAATADCTNPASWAAGGETRLSTTGSFDMTTAPDAGGYFVGDYEGLTASGTTLDPFFVMAHPIATTGLTDPFASTAH
jgi:BNR/Asp-box repeat